MELTPQFLRGVAGDLALECRVKDLALAELEGKLAAARTETATLRAKLDALSAHHAPDGADGGEG